ncbi:hypothetical protein E2562_017554, partial [Oryza meyeriana var. granulata]
ISSTPRLPKLSSRLLCEPRGSCSEGLRLGAPPEHLLVDLEVTLMDLNFLGETTRVLKSS